MAAVRHLKFLSNGSLGWRFSVTVPNLVYKMLINAEIMAQKSKSKMAAVRHLELPKT